VYFDDDYDDICWQPTEQHNIVSVVCVPIILYVGCCFSTYNVALIIIIIVVVVVVVILIALESFNFYHASVCLCIHSTILLWQVHHTPLLYQNECTYRQILSTIW